MAKLTVLAIAVVLLGTTTFAQNPFFSGDLKELISPKLDDSVWSHNSEFQSGLIRQNVLPSLWKQILGSGDHSAILERIETVLGTSNDTEICLQDVSQMFKELAKLFNLTSPPGDVAPWALHSKFFPFSELLTLERLIICDYYVKW